MGGWTCDKFVGWKPPANSSKVFQNARCNVGKCSPRKKCVARGRPRAERATPVQLATAHGEGFLPGGLAPRFGFAVRPCLNCDRVMLHGPYFGSACRCHVLRAVQYFRLSPNRWTAVTTRVNGGRELSG